MKAYRIMQDLGNGYCKKTNYAKQENGQTVYSPANDQRVYKTRQINPKCTFINQEQMKQLPYAVKQAESPQGRPDLYRAESGQGVVIATRRPLKVVISNGHTAPEDILVGDAHGLVAWKENIPAKNAATTIDGTYGAETLNFIAAITGSNPFDVHGLHLVGSTTAGANSEAVFNSGRLRTFEVDPDAQTVKYGEISVSDMVMPSDQQSHIRYDRDFRFQFNGFTGVRALVPNGERLTMTFKHLSAVHLTFNMNKL